MTLEEAAEVILGGVQWEKCPEGCDWGRVEVNKFEPTHKNEDVIFTVSFAKGVLPKQWVKCKRCNGTGQVKPQVYIEASAQLGMLVPHYPVPQPQALDTLVAYSHHTDKPKTKP